MVNAVKRVVDQFGNQVKLCCHNDFLFFTQNNEFIRLKPSDEDSYMVDGSIFYQIASSITGVKK